jgi:signal transduction histidine kinase/DNA-binding CsgD family transcriptional regulator
MMEVGRLIVILSFPILRRIYYMEYTPFSAQRKSSLLLDNLASLSAVFELVLTSEAEIEPEEIRTRILTHICQAMRAQGACLLLYYKAQERLVPVASQGERLPCGTLASIIDNHDIEQMRGPGLSTIQLEGLCIVLVSLICHDVFFGLVALTFADADSLLDERRLLLTYMGNVAAQILYTSEMHSNELRSALAQERNRIARNLHDGVVQQLAYILFKLEFSQHLLETGQTRQVIAEIERISTILNASLQELRSTMTSLLPPQLNTHSFSDALASLLQDYQLDNPTISLEQELVLLPPMPASLEATIFRVIQEALNNIHKHAQATRIILRIQLLPNAVQLEIRDNGRGFDPQDILNSPYTHYMRPDTMHNGLRGMQERIQEAAGTWHIVSLPEAGTTIYATFPLMCPDLEFTQRESEVLQLIVSGLDNHAIARKLSIRSETVQKYVQHIAQKLQVKDRSQVAVMASKFKFRDYIE